MARAPSIDLSSLSVRELKDLRLKLDAAIAEREKLERAELKAKMAAIAADAGFSLDELVGGKKGRAGGKGMSAVKYRNPESPDETWTGRGRRPVWLSEKLSKRGAKIEDFAV